MYRLSTETRAQALNMLVEGSSMRATSRILGVSQNTVAKLLVDAGETCLALHDERVRDVRARSVQCDEIWAFTYSKQRNAPYARGVIDGAGDVWTWTAIEQDTKLLISWLVGDRGSETALTFMDDLRSRVTDRIQLATDGHLAYPMAVEGAFGGYVDYGQVIKVYGYDGETEQERRYSSPQCISLVKRPVVGDPDMSELNTSHVERHNLTMRMSMRRFTRLTNAYSKKVQNHIYAVALYAVWYNFIRPHRSLGGTPAMASGLAEYPLDLRWLVNEMNDRAPAPRRGLYGISRWLTDEDEAVRPPLDQQNRNTNIST